MRKKHIIYRLLSIIGTLSIIMSLLCVAYADSSPDVDPSKFDTEGNNSGSYSLLWTYPIFNKVASYHPLWSETKCDYGLALNLATESSTTIATNTNVNLYTTTGHITQKWKFIEDENGKYRVVSMVNQRYAWNVNRYGGSYNCDVMPYVGNETDSEIASHKGSGTAVNFQLQNYQQYYLLVKGDTSGVNAVWYKDVVPWEWAGGFLYTIYE